MLLNRAERVRYEEVIRSKWARFLNGENGMWMGGAIAIPLGKGGDPVPRVPDDLELERIRNLISGFGWVVVKQEFTPDRIEVVIELKREAAPKEPSDDSV